MTYYLTKYALTIGIREMPAATELVTSAGGTQYVSVGGLFTSDFAKNKTDAVNRARQTRDAKIKSLKKQIAKLESLAFNADEIKPWGSK